MVLYFPLQWRHNEGDGVMKIKFVVFLYFNQSVYFHFVHYMVCVDLSLMPLPFQPYKINLYFKDIVRI